MINLLKNNNINIQFLTHSQRICPLSYTFKYGSSLISSLSVLPSSGQTKWVLKVI